MYQHKKKVILTDNEYFKLKFCHFMTILTDDFSENKNHKTKKNNEYFKLKFCHFMTILTDDFSENKNHKTKKNYKTRLSCRINFSFVNLNKKQLLIAQIKRYLGVYAQ